MNLRAIFTSGAFFAFAVQGLSQTAPAPARPAAQGETVQLSAFEVTTSKDIGYQSSNSAEVTRVKIPGASSGAFDPATHHVHPTLANPSSHERERVEARPGGPDRS